jgi:hypothetical protein
VRTVEAPKWFPRVKRICGTVGSAEPLTSRRRLRQRRCSGTYRRLNSPGSVGDGMPGRGAADKAGSLAGCKSPYRQLPAFRRLAYLVRAAATKHDRPGCKSPSCPAVVFAAVGTTRGASKLGGRNITKYLQPRKHALREVVRGIDAGSRPTSFRGEGRWHRGRNRRKHTVYRRGMGSSIQGEILRITSGSCREQQGLVTTCKDSPNEAKSRRRRELNGSGE